LTQIRIYCLREACVSCMLQRPITELHVLEMSYELREFNETVEVAEDRELVQDTEAAIREVGEVDSTAYGKRVLAVRLYM